MCKNTFPLLVHWIITMNATPYIFFVRLQLGSTYMQISITNDLFVIVLGPRLQYILHLYSLILLYTILLVSYNQCMQVRTLSKSAYSNQIIHLYTTLTISSLTRMQITGKYSFTKSLHYKDRMSNQWQMCDLTHQIFLSNRKQVTHSQKCLLNFFLQGRYFIMNYTHNDTKPILYISI